MMPLPDIISHKMRESELFSSLKNKITDTDLIDEIYDWAGYNLNLKSLLQKYLSMWRYNENRVKKMQKQIEKKWPAAYEDFIRFTEIVRANRNRPLLLPVHLPPWFGEGVDPPVPQFFSTLRACPTSHRLPPE